MFGGGVKAAALGRKTFSAVVARMRGGKGQQLAWLNGHLLLV